jgi:hypothetical protein
MTNTAASPKPIKSLDAWAKAAVHTVMCPSGTAIEIRIPDLAGLIEGGELPQHLLQAALKAAGNQSFSEEKEVTVDDIRREREFTNFLVAKTVVTPALTPETATQVPTEDREMIAALALRLRDLDAEGSHIAGLDSSEKFRKFRGLGEFEPTLEG